MKIYKPEIKVVISKEVFFLPDFGWFFITFFNQMLNIPPQNEFDLGKKKKDKKMGTGHKYNVQLYPQ